MAILPYSQMSSLPCPPLDPSHALFDVLRDAHPPPRQMYALGPTPLERRRVAIVGSRDADAYGLAVARHLGSYLGFAGAVVVSGGARGVDAAAHEGALEAGAPTWAVLAGGVDCPSPRSNAELFARIVSSGGALLSERPPNARPERWAFVARNRLVAAIADAVVVVSAEAKSGALHTARFAAQQGRAVFAVPGDITASCSVGCNALIAGGLARILVHPDQLLGDLGQGRGRPAPRPHGAARWPSPGPRRGPLPLAWRRSKPDRGGEPEPAWPQDDVATMAVWEALREGPVTTEALVARAGEAAAQVLRAVAMLELEGRVERTSDGALQRRA